MFFAPKAKRQVHELKTPQEQSTLRRVTAGAHVFAVTGRLKPCPRKASTVAEMNMLLCLLFLKGLGALWPAFYSASIEICLNAVTSNNQVSVNLSDGITGKLRKDKVKNKWKSRVG